MTTVMTRAAREQFLADVHVGVLSVAVPEADGGSTIAVPIWYDFTPERGVWVITSQVSPKGKALAATGRYALVVQEEATPYRYVSVEGPVVEARPTDLEGDLLPMAIRYLGEEVGARYAHGWAAGDNRNDLVYTIRPQRWASADMSAAFAQLTTPAPTG